MKKQKHYVILSASTGAGHIRAAEALEKCAAEKFPEIKVTHIDAMKYVTRLFKGIYAGTYIGLAKNHQEIWGYIYNKTDKSPNELRLRKLRLLLQKFNMGNLKKKFLELNPDHVICTHFLPAEMLDRAIIKGVTMPGKKALPQVSVVVTDFDVHWMWTLKNLNQFFVANEEAQLRLASRGVKPKIIHNTGIPVCPEFGRKYNKKKSKKNLQLDPEKITVLLMAGGYGVGKIDETAERLIKDIPGIQVIGIAGKNKDLEKSLQKVSAKYKGKILAVGFTTEVEKYMAASDIVITKTGGLTSSECLAIGRPMIVINPIPGQEERNATYLIEHGAAVMAYDQIGLDYKLKNIITTPGRLIKMQKAARAIGKPNAGFDIWEEIIRKG